MSKGRTTGDRLDGVKVKEDGQEDKILDATLNGLSEKKIKALISKMLEEGE